MTKLSEKPSIISIIAWTICLLAALFYGYDFLLRIIPSIMMKPLMRTYGVGATSIGLLSAFYYYAYTPLQVPAGMIVDRYSTRLVLTLAALVCTLGAFMFAMVHNLYIAYVARAFMGIGSAFAFIATLRLASVWLPKSRFGLFTGIATGLGTLGALTADIVLSRLVTNVGWQETAYISAIAGVILTILLVTMIRNRPKDKPAPTKRALGWSHEWIRLKFIAKNWRFWVNGLVGSLTFLPVSVFASLWGISFLEEAYQLPVEHAATATSLIFLGTAFGGPTAGWISDRLKNRRIPIAIGTFGSMIMVFSILFITGMPIHVLYAALFALGFCVGSQVLVFAIGHEISPIRATGSATAMTNFIITMGAAVFQPFIGYLLDSMWTGSMAHGVRQYTEHTYQLALLVLPLLLVFSLLITFLIPETHGKFLNKYLSKKYFIKK